MQLQISGELKSKKVTLPKLNKHNKYKQWQKRAVYDLYRGLIQSTEMASLREELQQKDRNYFLLFLIQLKKGCLMASSRVILFVTSYSSILSMRSNSCSWSELLETKYCCKKQLLIKSQQSKSCLFLNAFTV